MLTRIAKAGATGRTKRSFSRRPASSSHRSRRTCAAREAPAAACRHRFRRPWASGPQIQALKSGVESRDRRAGAFARPHGPGLRRLFRARFSRARRGGPHARHGLPAVHSPAVAGAAAENRQTLLFSATLSKEIESLTHDFQKSPKTVQIGRQVESRGDRHAVRL